MSKLPTLLVAGNLQDKPKDVIPLDDICGWIQQKQNVKHATHRSRVMVIQSETGSGKTTALTVALLRFTRPKDMPTTQRLIGPGVVCTQPRVLTAKSSAEEITTTGYYPDCILGETVGYRTEELSCIPKRRGLIYATAGILATQLKTLDDETIMEMYQFIQVDEAHERQVECDLLLLLIKQFFMRNAGNPNLPFLVLTSATFDTQKYANYFKVGIENTWRVTGRAYEITCHWADAPVDNYITEAAKIAHDITVKNPDDLPGKSDILIFLPGQAEIINVAFLLEQNKKTNYMVMTLSRDIVQKEGKELKNIKAEIDELPLNHNKLKTNRRIILTTVVAETGITLESLKYIIDSGWHKSGEYFPVFNYSGILVLPEAQSRVRQRRGRVGRKFDGEFYALYTQETFEALESQQLPDVITKGISSNLLSIIQAQQCRKFKMGEKSEFSIYDMVDDLLDMPSPADLMTHLSLLKQFGMISDNALLFDGLMHGNGLTAIGKVASKFMRTPLLGIHAIFCAYSKKISVLDMVSVVAFFEVRELYVRDMITMALIQIKDLKFKNNELVEKAKIVAKCSQINNDFAEIALIYGQFSAVLAETPEVIGTWCKKYNLSNDALISMTKIRDFIIKEMITAGLDPFVNEHLQLSEVSMKEFPQVLKEFTSCIALAFESNVLTHVPDEGPMYVSKKGLKIEVKSLKQAKIFPKKLITNEIIIKLKKEYPKKRENFDEIIFNHPKIHILKPGIICEYPDENTQKICDDGIKNGIKGEDFSSFVLTRE